MLMMAVTKLLFSPYPGWCQSPPPHRDMEQRCGTVDTEVRTQGFLQWPYKQLNKASSRISIGYWLQTAIYIIIDMNDCHEKKGEALKKHIKSFKS